MSQALTGHFQGRRFASLRRHQFSGVQMTAAEFQSLNSPIGILGNPSHSASIRRLPFALLPFRLILFATFQLAIAAIAWTASGVFSYQGAGIYWPYSATAANIATFFVLRSCFWKERLALVDLYRFTKTTARADTIVAIVVLVIAAPLSFFPNTILASALFGDPLGANRWLFGLMPRALAYLTVLFPLTIAFAELPLYMGYILPRLSLRLNSKTAAVFITGFFLALQHCTLPIVFDLRFVVWRLGIFLPLALLFASVLSWRPRLMPYMMVIHALLDFGAVGLILSMNSQR